MTEIVLPQACADVQRDLAALALAFGEAAGFVGFADFVALAALDALDGLVDFAGFVALVGVAAAFLAVRDVFLAPPSGAAGCTPQS